jgi:hypothetical protein
VNHPILIRKTDGTTEPFNEVKLMQSLARAGAKPSTVNEIVASVVKDMREGMTTTDIYRQAFQLLKNHSEKIAVKYSIRRALSELGPDGFPFEKFVARVFKMWGYETVTDQMLMGTCVQHEVDVVAWKGSELAMVEAKFHNEIGLKSDLKVVLYVKARFDDLSGSVFKYGGKERKLTERWLITNTKFTDRAVTYGTCQHLNLVGWNYPSHNSLHTLIEANSLHPITCITSLTNQEKKDLIGRNVLVCIDLIASEHFLHDIGVKPDRFEKIIAEAKEITKAT